MIEEVRPQVVVVTLLEGDVYRQPYDDPAEHTAEVRRNRWRNRIRAASRLVTMLVRWRERTRQSAAVAAVRNEQPHSTEGYARCWQRDRVRLDEMRMLCEQRGATFLVAGWPQQDETTEFFREKLVEWGAESKTLTVDLHDVLATVHKSARKLADGHPNELGYRLAAGPIGAALRRCLEEVQFEATDEADGKAGQ